MMARAMAMRCFWPPDICRPFSPTFVFTPSGRSLMNFQALADLSAAICEQWSATGAVTAVLHTSSEALETCQPPPTRSSPHPPIAPRSLTTSSSVAPGLP